EAAWRIPAMRAAAIDWLATAKGPAEVEAWLRLGQQDPAEVIAALREATPQLRARAFRVDGLPIAQLAPLAADADLAVLKRLRDPRDFTSAPAELLAHAIEAGCAYRFLEAFQGRLAAGDVPSAELLARLAAYCSERLVEIERGRCLRDELPPRRWPTRYHYTNLLEAIRAQR